MHIHWWRVGLFPIAACHGLAISGNPQHRVVDHSSGDAWRDVQDAARANQAFIHDDLQLIETASGYRGVHYSGETTITPGDTILKIPLESLCICSNPNDEDWALDLARKLQDRMLITRDDPDVDSSRNVDAQWFALFPKPHDLSPTLPVHWDEALLELVGSHAMQAAVDAAYFARGEVKNDMVSYCLDLVQTRVCRVGDDTRCLAPLFDCLNHHDVHTNCAFHSDSGHLIVSAIAEIRNSDELFIHYGEASTSPSWRCLVSYGFVPPVGNENDEAEVFLNGQRFLIQEGEVSEDLVAMYSSECDDVSFDAASATAIADTLKDYVHKELQRCIRSTKSYEATTDSVATSKQLALELLSRDKRVVEKCATNLRQWASKEQDMNAPS